MSETMDSLRAVVEALAETVDNQKAELKWLQNHFHISSSEITDIPCVKCGGPVKAFLIPDEIWNLVVRRGGSEGTGEYLCYDCWLAAVGAKVERLQAMADAVGELDGENVRVMGGLPSGTVCVRKSVIDQIQVRWLEWREAAKAEEGGT